MYLPLFSTIKFVYTLSMNVPLFVVLKVSGKTVFKEYFSSNSTKDFFLETPH